VSADDVARKVAEYAETHPGTSTLFGTGVAAALLTSGSANRQVLDKVLPDRGVVLLDETNHNAWVNTKALELAGVTRDTPNPAGGTSAKDSNVSCPGSSRARRPISLSSTRRRP